MLLSGVKWEQEKEDNDYDAADDVDLDYYGGDDELDNEMLSC